MLANSAEWLSMLWFVFMYVQMVSTLGDYIVQANFIQFDNDFTGLGAEVGMFLQCTFKTFLHKLG